MTKVSNGAFGKIIRTIGYFFVFIGSFLLLIDALQIINISFINDYVSITKDYIRINFSNQLIDLKFLYLIMGVLFLINTLNNSYTIRIILSLLLLLTTINIQLTGAYYFPELMGNIIPGMGEIGFLENILNDTINQVNLVALTVSIITPLLIYILITSKKPNRIATGLVGTAMLLVTISMLFIAIPIATDIPFFETAFFQTITNYLIAISFLLSSLGSVFGFAGFFRG